MLVENIKRLCEERGTSIWALENKANLGIANGNIARWDEQRPSVDKVKAVADYLGVTVDMLLSDK